MIKDNRVIDYPVYGGHDRKASGGSNPPVQEVEYEYFEVPKSFFQSMGSDFETAFIMYPGWCSASYVSTFGGTVRKQLIDGVSLTICMNRPADKTLIKVPKIHVIMIDNDSPENPIEGNTMKEWLESYAQVSSTSIISTKCQEFYGYAITESVFNQKLQELYDEYNS